jgi:hypothetical protein
MDILYGEFHRENKILYVLILSMGNFIGEFQKQTFIECDRPDKRRVSYESRRPWYLRKKVLHG